MNKYICFASVILAAIASASCSGYGNLANLALNSYGGAAPSYGGAASSYGGDAAGYSGYSAPAASYGGGSSYNSYAAPKSYAPKYSFQPLHSTELYPGQGGYKHYNSHASYSQVALPVVQDAPLAKLYSPAAKSYGGYGSQSYGGSPSYGGSQSAY
ncbi:chorion protein S19 [Musca domestica]|uniref:Chorion protein S19 n=1 Tax=Musca domestica TaxID=7370 RepID=A0A1I8MGM1_MUSDO|nr:chorion protein S19 [Musca domestica]